MFDYNQKVSANRVLLKWLNDHQIKFKDAATVLGTDPNELRSVATMWGSDPDTLERQDRILGRLRRLIHVR